MFKNKTFKQPAPLRFKCFSRRGYALFACLGREVLIGTLSVATLTYAKADGISVRTDLASDSLHHDEKELQEVVVHGSRAPLTAWQSGTQVEVITREEILRAEAQTINDVLKLATGVDVRQRGGFGVQTDISINGGTFDQIVILLNGVNISNPQTGHNATDFPLSLHDIERIEIIEGAASRVFGASAFSGAINIVTRGNGAKHDGPDARCEVQGGSFGTFGIQGNVALPAKSHSLAALLSAGYTRSDGGTDNSDFQKLHAYGNASWKSQRTDIDLQAGISAQDYGANTFYSAKYNRQYEETRRMVASAALTHRLATGISLHSTLYANHFDDQYQLTRGLSGTDKGENLHHLWVYGAAVDCNISWMAGKTSIGADLHGDHINSTALGTHTRSHVNLFAEHNVVLHRWTLSAGMHYGSISQEERLSAWSPGVNISFRPTSNWKLYAGWNRSMRAPTFTDLYMSNVVQQGDPTLKPERNSTVKGGVRWMKKNGNWKLEAETAAFYSHGTNMIDWVYDKEDATKYHALNIGRLDNSGFSIDGKMEYKAITAKMGYAFIHQSHATEREIYRSLYALEYLRHKLTAQISHPIPLPHQWERHGTLTATWAARWQQRMNGYTPYWKLDARLQWNASRYTVFVKADNLTGHRYYDIGSVVQPGLWLMAGASIEI